MFQLPCTALMQRSLLEVGIITLLGINQLLVGTALSACLLVYRVCITHTGTCSAYIGTDIQFSGYTVGLVTAGNSGSGLDKENFAPNCI